MALHSDDPRSVGGYKVVDRLGNGGMGVVYRARARSGREVAVKVVHAQYAQDPVFRTRFRQEIEAVRKVSGAFTAAGRGRRPGGGTPLDGDAVRARALARPADPRPAARSASPSCAPWPWGSSRRCGRSTGPVWCTGT